MFELSCCLLHVLVQDLVSCGSWPVACLPEVDQTAAASSHNFDSKQKTHFEGLESQNPNTYSKAIVNYYSSQEMYACKSSKPRGLDEDLKHELLKPNRTSMLVKSYNYGLVLTSGVSRDTSMICRHAFVQQHLAHHKML